MLRRLQGTGTRALAMAAATGATDILEALLQAPMVSVDAQVGGLRA